MKTESTDSQQLPKVATYIDGLDAILYGGIAKGRSTLVHGGPGSGKSLFGLEMLYRNALKGVAGIFVAFEESSEAIRRNVLTLGWDFSELEKKGLLFILDAQLDPAIVMAGDFNLNGLIKMIEAKASAMSADIIVLDSLDTLLQLLDNPIREKNELSSIREWLLKRGMTALLTVKQADETGAPGRYNFLDYMVDSVIRLDQRIESQISTRRLRVVKYRGSNYGKNEYPFSITASGINVISTSIGQFQHPAPGERLPMGNKVLDGLMGGGMRKGTCLLITGPSGIGKTTLSSEFTHAAHNRKECVLNINFEESQESVVSTMRSPGIDLDVAIEAGNLHFISIYPESQGSEEHLISAFRTIKQIQPAHVIVDAISACQRMGSEQAAIDYLVRLITFLKQASISCILINQTNVGENVEVLSGVGISSLVDSIIQMRYQNLGGELNRTLIVLKSRGSKISNQWREYNITDQGIEIMDTYTGMGGTLTGTARQEQAQVLAISKRLAEVNILKTRQEIKAQNAAMEAENARAQASIIASQAELQALEIESERLLDGIEERDGLRNVNSLSGDKI